MIRSKEFNEKYFSSGIYKDYKKLLAEWIEPVARKIYYIVKKNPSTKILDIGCAQGYLIAELQNKYNFDVNGLEYSAYAIQKADKSVSRKIKNGNILNPSFPSNSFDVVICFDVVSHLTLEETTKAIKNLVNITKDYIFFSTIYRHSYWASQKYNPDLLRRATLSKKEYIDMFSKNKARLVKEFYGENGGSILVFRKLSM